MNKRASLTLDPNGSALAVSLFGQGQRAEVDRRHRLWMTSVHHHIPASGSSLHPDVDEHTHGGQAHGLRGGCAGVGPTHEHDHPPWATHTPRSTRRSRFRGRRFVEHSGLDSLQHRGFVAKLWRYVRYRTSPQPRSQQCRNSGFCRNRKCREMSPGGRFPLTPRSTMPSMRRKPTLAYIRWLEALAGSNR